ncbi:MAG: FtsH protease activity modulator HflK [Planctomycetia bacterium]|nr:FtsH protease activity modulator HflK [Planctomycetia bacterium]
MNRKEKTVLVAMTANLLLIVLKFFLASLSGSVALKASAWHSFSDLIPSLVVLMGLILARRENIEATRGISRIENIIAIIVSGFIFYVGIEIVRDVFSRGAEELSNVPLVAVISLVSIAITYFMARYQIFVGRETNSPGLIANGTHARVDMYSSIVVVIALMGYIMGFTTLDRIAAAIIVLLILGNGLEVLTSAIKALRQGGFLDFAYHDESVFIMKIMRWSRRFVLVGLILFIVAYLASGIFIVRWNEEAIVKRFGKPIRQVEAGIHYRLPQPFEAVDRVAVTDVRMEKVPSSFMLTGDENLIEIEAVVHYQVKDAFAFNYNLSKPKDLVGSVVESILRQQINRNTIEFVLTDGKQQIQQMAQRLSQQVLDDRESGIKLLTIQLIKDTPPTDVMEAFRDVASAREDKNTYINEALAYQSEIVPKARGEAQKLIEEAYSYREQKTRTANGDAQRFLSKLQEYQKSREITKRRLYIEALEKTLANVNKLIIDEKVQVDNTDLWFFKGDLNKKFIKEINKP